MDSEIRYNTEILAFKKHIKKLRDSSGLTQKQLKERSTITQSQISLLENKTSSSNPEFETLVKLAFGFKIHMGSLFDYSSKRKFVLDKRFLNIQKRCDYEKVNFGKRIVQLINHRKLKQDEFSILVKIDAADISRYISGESNIELFNITKIALTLQVELVDLFDYEGLLPSNKDFKAKVI